jgi:hypothetical protein
MSVTTIQPDIVRDAWESIADDLIKTGRLSSEQYRRLQACEENVLRLRSVVPQVAKEIGLAIYAPRLK